jgi:hypothetical protein
MAYTLLCIIPYHVSYQLPGRWKKQGSQGFYAKGKSVLTNSWSEVIGKLIVRSASQEILRILWNSEVH